MLATNDLEGRPIFKEILEQKEGMINYRWLNAETKLPQDKIALFKTFSQLNWTIASSLNKSEATAPLVLLQKIMFGIVGVLTAIMILISFLLGKPMARQLGMVEDKISSSVRLSSENSVRIRDVSITLAESVTQQAAALQQTVSAMEEIRSTVQTNLSSTEKANRASKNLEQASVKARPP